MFSNKFNVVLYVQNLKNVAVFLFFSTKLFFLFQAFPVVLIFGFPVI